MCVCARTRVCARECECTPRSVVAKLMQYLASFSLYAALSYPSPSGCNTGCIIGAVIGEDVRARVRACVHACACS